VIVLDTTVLVYAVGIDHPLRDPCRAIVAAVGDRTVSATTTVEVVQEFAHVRARRRGRADARRLAASYVDLLSPLIAPDEDDLLAGLELFATNERVGAFDAVLASIARRRDHLAAIVSADRAFAELDGIDHVDPADARALAGLIGGHVADR
jgi:uncharacterized protein